jgi:hypothetical protein
MAAPVWLRPAILGLSALLLMAWSTPETLDPDTWWHLKTGQYIVQHHGLPVPDPFAFTTYLGKQAYRTEELTRYFNLTHEWLSQILLYLTYASSGFTGLILLRAALITTFCALMGLATYSRTKGFYRSVGAALAAATVACQFTADRPYLFTFVFLAATVAILEFRRWRFWILPALFLVWANFHGGFFVGWLALGAYCAESLFLRLRGKPQPDERLLWLAAIACILVSGINPNGFHVIPVMFSYRSSVLQSSVWEWQYPLPWPPTPFSTLLAGAVAMVFWKRRETRPVDWLLLFGFGTLAMLAVRNIFLAALVGPLLIASYIPWKKAFPAAAEFLVAILLLVGIGIPIVEGKAFQFHAADWKFPGGAADFLLAHHISGRMLNTYEIGGYLIWRLWPQEKVFVDGRALNEAAFQDYQRMAGNADSTTGKSAEDLLAQYGIEVIVMDGFEYNSGTPYMLPAALSDPKQTEWKLVYMDSVAVVYMRHPPPDVRVLNSFDALASLESQCSTTIEHEPFRPKCAAGLADLFARIGDGVRARRWQAIYLKSQE